MKWLQGQDSNLRMTCLTDKRFANLATPEQPGGSAVKVSDPVKIWRAGRDSNPHCADRQSAASRSATSAWSIHSESNREFRLRRAAPFPLDDGSQKWWSPCESNAYSRFRRPVPSPVRRRDRMVAGERIELSLDDSESSGLPLTEPATW
jgi:hypothetical protein